MLTTSELLAAVRAKQNLPSNYALAKFLDVRENDVSRWNTGKNTPNDQMALRLAGLSPEVVLTAMQAARCTDASLRPVWERIADRLQRAAAVVGMVAAGTLLSAPAPAPAQGTGADPVNIMSIIRCG